MTVTIDNRVFEAHKLRSQLSLVSRVLSVQGKYKESDRVREVELKAISRFERRLYKFEG